MSINWKLMIQLRERQRAEASDRVAKERKVVAESEAQVNAAQGQLRQQQDTKAALWRETHAAVQGGICSVEQLQFATKWSKALDIKAAEAAKAVKEAQVEMDKKMVVLNERRQALRVAMGDLEKAREMQSRQIKQLQQRIEARTEDAVDEWASHKWAAQQSRA